MTEERIILAGSFSRLKDYEKCPWMLWLKAGEKREPAIEPDEKAEAARNRGIQVHDDAQLFVEGKIEITKDLAKFADYFADLKVKYEAGEVILEEDWGFDQDWQPTGWWDDDVRVRMKLDNFITTSTDPEKGYILTGTATDYKTGKKFGNEITHNQQGQLYAIGAFMRYPTLEACNVDFVYLDHGLNSKPKQYTRQKAMKFLPSWQKRFNKIFEDREFRPKPNKINCKWCQYGPQNGDGSCEWGVDG